MDANGDGNTKDNDLTKAQSEALGRDFHSFIASHNGQNLSGNGLPVNNFGASQEAENLYRAISQFVGTARGGWGDTQWTLNIGTVQGFKDAKKRTQDGAAAWAWGPASLKSFIVYFDTEFPGMLRPSNI